MKHPTLLNIFILVFLMMGYCFEMKGQRFYISGGARYGTDFPSVNNTIKENKVFEDGAIGYYLNEEFNVEIGFNTFSQKYDIPEIDEYLKGSFHVIRLMPAIKIKFTKSFNAFYLKAGPSFGISGNDYREFYWFDDASGNSGNYKANYHGGIDGGFLFSVGKEIKLYQNTKIGIFSIFAELQTIHNFWKPKNISIIESYGTNYYNNLLLDYGTAAIHLGIKYSFGKKEKQ